MPPRIEVADLAGVEAALERRRGQGFLLNFWAIWCGPCVEELPELLEVAHEARPEGGGVLGVSYDLMVAGADLEGMPATMARFLEKKRLPMEVLLFDADDYEGINARFSLPGEVPVTLAIDASGSIVDRQEGKAGRERFAEMMRRALGED
ncbi:MAG: TlpA family protein disulfide reductase [Planctomycetes bacterium]|nr:TlpA family protein disulfide reductase [Planctomycetota bacterium]